MKTIQITWSTEDVIANAYGIGMPVSESQAEEILDSLRENHDSTIGINWDIISEYIRQYYENYEW